MLYPAHTLYTSGLNAAVWVVVTDNPQSTGNKAQVNCANPDAYWWQLVKRSSLIADSYDLIVMISFYYLFFHAILALVEISMLPWYSKNLYQDFLKSYEWKWNKKKHVDDKVVHDKNELLFYLWYVFVQYGYSSLITHIQIKDMYLFRCHILFTTRGK